MSEVTAPAASAPAAAQTPSPAPATPAAATPPPAAATPPAADAPKQTTVGSRLFNLLSQPGPTLEEIAAPKKKKEEPKVADAPAAAGTATPATAATPPPEKKSKEIKRRETPAAAAPAPAADTPPPVPRRKKDEPALAAAAASVAVASPAAPTPQVNDADFEKSLVEEEQAMLADARSAEKYLGDKYKGHAAKTTAFLKENLARMKALEKGDFNGKPYDEEDHKAWHAANLPKISVLDQRQLARLEVRDEVSRELQPKIEQESHARWRDSEEPKLQAEREDTKSRLRSIAYPDEVMAAATERLKGLKEGTPEYHAAAASVRADYALELNISDAAIEAASGDIQEFRRLTRKNPVTGKPIVAFDASNPTHERIITMVEEVCKDFKANAGTERFKDGKWFATREEWADMEPSERAKWWTFTDDQLVERAMARVPLAVKAITERERTRLEGLGFKRQIAAPSAAAPAAPAPALSGAPAAPRGAPPPVGGGAPVTSRGRALAAQLATS